MVDWQIGKSGKLRGERATMVKVAKRQMAMPDRVVGRKGGGKMAKLIRGKTGNW